MLQLTKVGEFVLPLIINMMVSHVFSICVLIDISYINLFFNHMPGYRPSYDLDTRKSLVGILKCVSSFARYAVSVCFNSICKGWGCKVVANALLSNLIFFP